MIDQRVERALCAPEPVHEVRPFVLELLAEGQSREAVLERFERAGQQLRQAGHEADEDAVTDVMDFRVGWCSPHMKLPPEQPATEERT